MIYNKFQLVSEAIDNPKKKDSKAKKAIKRSILVGGTVGVAAGAGRSYPEYKRLNNHYAKVKQLLMQRLGTEKGSDLWKRFKQSHEYKVEWNQSAKTVLKTGGTAAAVAFLLHLFYAWHKYHKIEKDLPKHPSN